MSDPVSLPPQVRFAMAPPGSGDSFDIDHLDCETGVRTRIYVRAGRLFLIDPGLPNTSGQTFKVASACGTNPSTGSFFV